MRKDPPAKWPSDRSQDGLLFFAQVMDEMLFDYAPDSYRVPTLNTLGRVREASLILDKIAINEIRAGNLPPVLEELCWSIREDLVVKEILGGRIDFVETGLKDPGNIEAVGQSISYILRNLEGRYEDKCVELLDKRISSIKDKSEIYKLTQSYCVSICAKHSRTHIYNKVQKTFLQNDKKNIPTFIDFHKSLDTTPQKYEIYCKISKSLSDFFVRLDIPDLKIIDKNDLPKVKTKKAKSYFSLKSGESVLMILSDDLPDDDSARTFTEDVFDLFTSILYSLIHTGDFSWSAEMYVRQEGASVGHLCSAPTSELLKRPDIPYDKTISSFGKQMNMLFSHPTSTGKYLSALKTHAAAIKSPGTDTQLVTLWSSLEALIPNAEAGSNISVHMKYLVPAILLSCVRQNFKNVYSDIKRMYRWDFFKVLKKCDYPGNTLEKFCVSVTLDKYKKVYAELEALAVNNPLARFRLNKLRTSLSSPKSIKRYIQMHKKMVRWQVQRIYRARNALVHTGSNHEIDTRSLLVHFHEYYDTMMDNINYYVNTNTSKPHLDEMFNELKMDYKIYEGYLNQFTDKDKLTLDNFKILLGIALNSKS